LADLSLPGVVRSCPTGVRACRADDLRQRLSRAVAVEKGCAPNRAIGKRGAWALARICFHGLSREIACLATAFCSVCPASPFVPKPSVEEGVGELHAGIGIRRKSPCPPLSATRETGYFSGTLSRLPVRAFARFLPVCLCPSCFLQIDLYAVARFCETSAREIGRKRCSKSLRTMMSEGRSPASAAGSSNRGNLPRIA